MLIQAMITVDGEKKAFSLKSRSLYRFFKRARTRYPNMTAIVIVVDGLKPGEKFG